MNVKNTTDTEANELAHLRACPYLTRYGQREPNRVPRRNVNMLREKGLFLSNNHERQMKMISQQYKVQGKTKNFFKITRIHTVECFQSMRPKKSSRWPPCSSQAASFTKRARLPWPWPTGRRSVPGSLRLRPCYPLYERACVRSKRE